jgi:hypothetical protein
MGSEVLMTVSIKITVFLDMTPCSLKNNVSMFWSILLTPYSGYKMILLSIIVPAPLLYANWWFSKRWVSSYPHPSYNPRTAHAQPFRYSDSMRIITSRKMRWTGHVARIGKHECVQDFGGRVILKLILEK